MAGLFLCFCCCEFVFFRGDWVDQESNCKLMRIGERGDLHLEVDSRREHHLSLRVPRS